MTIVGISGFSGSGKDTMADRLVSRHSFAKTSLATPLKEMAKIAFGFSDEQLYGPSEMREKTDKRHRFSGVCPHCHHPCIDYRSGPSSENDCRAGCVFWCNSCGEQYPEYITPRLALQTLGTEWGRTLCKDLWVTSTLNYIRNHSHASNNWVIPDVRFRNEVQGIQDAGGVVVRVKRGVSRFKHASEEEMNSIQDREFDLVLDNEGTMLEFMQRIDESVERLHYLAGP
jgi:hypothetical protein